MKITPYPLSDEEVKTGNEILESMELCREAGEDKACMLCTTIRKIPGFCNTYCDVLFNLISAGLASQRGEESIDVTAPEHVQIEVKNDGKVVWVNTETGCKFRACQIKNLEITDNRGE